MFLFCFNPFLAEVDCAVDLEHLIIDECLCVPLEDKEEGWVESYEEERRFSDECCLEECDLNEELEFVSPSLDLCRDLDLDHM